MFEDQRCGVENAEASAGENPRSGRIRCGSLTLDAGGRRAWIAGTPIHLTAREYRLAEILALKADRVLSRDEVLADLYRGEPRPSAKSLEVFVCHLRRKLWAASGGRSAIETVPGRGYVMRAGRVA